jgi:uncharacterized protein (TIGR00369 family)
MSEPELPALQDLLPQENYIHDLRIHTETVLDDSAVGHLEVTQDLRTEHGTIDLGALFALMDATSGRLAVRVAHPDIVVTSEMSLHALGPLHGDVLTARGTLLRKGRRTVAIEMSILEHGTATEVAVSEAIFTTLPARVPVRPSTEGSLFAPGPHVDRPVRERSGIRVLDPSRGCVEAPISEYNRNHVQTLHGALVASIADTAAEQLATATTGVRHATLDLSVRFLGLGRVGPVRTSARALRSSSESMLCRVRLTDAGDEDRLIAVATAATATLRASS